MGGGRGGCAELCSGVRDGIHLRAGPCLCFPGLAAVCCSGFPRNHVPWGHLGWGSEGETGWPFCPGPSPASGACSSGRRGRPREPAAQSGRPVARTVHRLTGVLLGLGPWETEAPALRCQACSPQATWVTHSSEAFLRSPGRSLLSPDPLWGPRTAFSNHSRRGHSPLARATHVHAPMCPRAHAHAERSQEQHSAPRANCGRLLGCVRARWGGGTRLWDVSLPVFWGCCCDPRLTHAWGPSSALLLAALMGGVSEPRWACVRWGGAQDGCLWPRS